MTHLSIGNQIISQAEIPHLLAGYQMLPQLCRLLVIETAIAGFELTSSEKLGVIEQFYQNNQLTTPQARAKALEQYSMSLEQLEAVAMRELKIEKLKQATWGTKLESYFLQCKSQLDKVIYSLIRTSDAEVAQELYFRIKAGEQTFAECASVYSLGAEAQTQGMLGPVTISQPHPAIAQKLTISQPGQLWPPMKLDEWFVIVRLEKLIPAQLDDAMRSTLLNHLFETWLAEEMSKAQLTIHEEESGREGESPGGTEGVRECEISHPPTLPHSHTPSSPALLTR
ncbi:peptidyl-prolyl cis-trans isomerase [Nostoc sp. CHAB 5715]|uniref:peptidylprolyl isomerase n=1 Tax=Nostoc sp. CHAB 5715 TaxID=2780400 RepID=UPI001E4D43E3|nr:peptidyl-prolyl cis-trans isomerase [Nostoc sp. CHAB 5715]MCC5625282.1 peptidyl-prolyl cis-trans isomerase [Nostoc sp. CHAB 5715]